MPLVYGELRRVAAHFLERERAGQTLQATALVNEAFLEVRKIGNIDWQGRSHFIGVAAKVMRQVLIERARQRQAQKRGGQFVRVPVTDLDGLATEDDPNLLALDEALDELAKEYPRQAKVVELKFFGGLTAEESVAVLSEATGETVSARTIERDWRFARAWLEQALSAAR